MQAGIVGKQIQTVGLAKKSEALEMAQTVRNFMTKTEFTAFLAKKHKIPLNAAEKILNAFLDSVEDALYKDRKVVLPGFGTLACKTRQARLGRNPGTGAAINIQASTAVVFRAAAALKERLL